MLVISKYFPVIDYYTKKLVRFVVFVENLWLKDKLAVSSPEAETFKFQMATSSVLPRVTWKGQS